MGGGGGVGLWGGFFVVLLRGGSLWVWWLGFGGWGLMFNVGGGGVSIG